MVGLVMLAAGVGWIACAVPWVRSLPVLFLWIVAVAVVTIVVVGVVLYVASTLIAAFRGKIHDGQLAPASEADATITSNCIERSMRAYRNPDRAIFRYVDGYWFEGGVFGWVDDSDKDSLYVVFRGTSEIGNWFLTNGQAHMAKAAAVFGERVPGGLHQGFLKAFQRLWHDRPAMSAVDTVWKPASEYHSTKWFLAPLWTFVLAIPIAVAVHLHPAELFTKFGFHDLADAWRLAGVDFQPPAAFANFNLPSLCALTIALLAAVQFTFAHSWFEAFFERADTLVLGPALSKEVRESAASRRRVVFTGHSLGGALATLAFIDFYLSATSDTKTDTDTETQIDLFTFGAPQVGNDDFWTWFRELPHNRRGITFSIVADKGDPVARLPPAKTFMRSALGTPTPIGAMLASVYLIGWKPYARCYGVAPGSEWESIVSWLGSSGMALSKHKDSYLALLDKLRAKSSLAAADSRVAGHD